MHILLSGPMTGRPNFNHDAFNAAAKQFRDSGHLVTNPAEVDGGSQNKPREFYMRRDIEAILAAAPDAVLVMLPSWWLSNGAQLEYQIATEIGLRVVFFPEAQEEFLTGAKETRDGCDKVCTADV